MFEAHSLTSSELFSEHVTLPFQRFNRSHKDTFKPISIWFIEGKQKHRNQAIERCIFVYSEYRDNQGRNRFNCQTYPYPDCLTQRDLDRFIQLATEQPLALA